MTRKNVEFRGQKSHKTRDLRNARNKLKKAKAEGYATVRGQYESDEALGLQLVENNGYDPDNELSMDMYSLWLDKQDELATQPIKEKALPPTLRRQMFENTTLVNTTQGGSVSKRTVPAMHHPEYQATLEKSESVADARKRRAEWNRS